jgi:hypothetical protein
MMCVAWLSLGPLTWDGLLTFLTGVLAFAAGLLAFFGIRSQIRHADAGLQKQLDANAQSRREAEHARRRAVATALLFELDNFYRAYVRGLAEAIACAPGQVDGRDYLESPHLPPLRKTPSDPFPVYKANADAVGELPLEVTELVVRAYSAAQWVLDRRADYQTSREQSLQRGNQGPYFAFASKSLEEMRDVFRAAEGTLRETTMTLCEFTGTPFQFPRIAVAEPEKPSAEEPLPVPVAKKVK